MTAKADDLPVSDATERPFQTDTCPLERQWPERRQRVGKRRLRISAKNRKKGPTASGQRV